MTRLGLAAVLPREVTEAFMPLLAEEVERTDPLEEERFSFDEGRRSARLLPMPPREPPLPAYRRSG